MCIYEICIVPCCYLLKKPMFEKVKQKSILEYFAFTLILSVLL